MKKMWYDLVLELDNIIKKQMKKLLLILLLSCSMMAVQAQRGHCTVEYKMGMWSYEFELINKDCVLLIEQNDYRKVYRSWDHGEYMFWYFRSIALGLDVYELYKFNQGVRNNNNVNVFVWD